MMPNFSRERRLLSVLFILRNKSLFKFVSTEFCSTVAMKFVPLISLEVCICGGRRGETGKRRNGLSFFIIILKFPFTFSNVQRKSLEVVRNTFAYKLSEAPWSNIWSPKPTNFLAGYLNYFFTSCKLWLKLEMTFRDSTANDGKNICNIVSGFMFPKDLVKFFTSLPVLFWGPAEQRSFCLFYPSDDFALPDMGL